jgi:hypothetical protein
MKDDLSKCVNTTINILNEYLNRKSNYYLKYRLTYLGDKENPCISKIDFPYRKHKFNYTRRKENESLPPNSLSKSLSLYK